MNAGHCQGIYLSTNALLLFLLLFLWMIERGGLVIDPQSRLSTIVSLHSPPLQLRQDLLYAVALDPKTEHMSQTNE